MTLSDVFRERPDWRKESDYAYAGRLTRREWAWEFLRRNSDFQRELGVALEHANYQREEVSLSVVKSPVDLTKWGVMFCDIITL